MDHVLRLQLLEADQATADETVTGESTCSRNNCSFYIADGYVGP
jgi:hypothetical protein